ncbi:MAG: dienelactone hydrolase family protein, partial [Candidatus Aminicenantes bacterium]|nr:dienelactone hydrolase family protein [Candidatus Aminicenantes bacterium]
MDQKIIDLYGKYSNGYLNRREFLKKLTVLAGSTAAAVTLLPLLQKSFVQAQVVPEDDPRLVIEDITYPAQGTQMMAHIARPKGDEKFPGVIVIHENRGLNPHTEDVARRVALEGFLAIAPDASSPLGGTPDDVNEARTLMGKLDGPSTIKNFVAAVQYLKTHPNSTGKVGCMGFCWGGGMTNQVAVNAPDLSAAVPFYGSQPKVEDVPKIKASLLCHYAGLDERINAGMEAFEAALKEASIDYKMYVYEGAGHAFFNDTGTRYHKEAAELAW